MESAMRRGNSRGFTAIEMLGVLTLMAIVAASASLSLVRMQRDSDLAGVIDRLKYFDDLTRQQAEKSGVPMLLSFDIAGQVQRNLSSASPGDSPLATLRLAGGFSIERVMVAATDQANVAISTNGLSPTYALLLARQSQRRWMIVSAVGDVRQAADDGTVEYEMDQLREP
jgi:prepilin-type N-terminal cleavage/methylation domain-containing protein